MKQIVCVDPGLNACGVAIFSGETGRLEHAALVENLRIACDLPTRWEGMALAVGQWLSPQSARPTVNRTLVVEMPKIYSAAKSKGDPNDIVNLAGVVAAVTTLTPCSGRRLLFPRDWKGTIDPDDLIDRWIKPRLSPIEHTKVSLPTAESLQHNVWDAIGIGLHVVGRLEPRRVIAR